MLCGVGYNVWPRLQNVMSYMSFHNYLNSFNPNSWITSKRNCLVQGVQIGLCPFLSFVTGVFPERIFVGKNNKGSVTSNFKVRDG